MCKVIYINSKFFIVKKEKQSTKQNQGLYTGQTNKIDDIKLFFVYVVNVVPQMWPTLFAARYHFHTRTHFFAIYPSGDLVEAILSPFDMRMKLGYFTMKWDTEQFSNDEVKKKLYKMHGNTIIMAYYLFVESLLSVCSNKIGFILTIVFHTYFFRCYAAHKIIGWNPLCTEEDRFR